MGYVTKDIATITEPRIVSLAGAPNFVTFASKAGAKTYIDVDIRVVVLPTTPNAATASTLRVYEANGTLHEFHGTIDPEEVGGSVFLISADPADTAENLRQALIANTWLDANFEVRIAAKWSGAFVVNGDTINIKGKGAGADFRLNVTAPSNVGNSAYVITWASNTSNDGDTIKGNAPSVEIELDIFENPDVTLGGDDRPLDENKLGTRTVSLQKTYTGAPVWFDLNGIFRRYGKYNPPADNWFATGTVKVFRFVAKVRATNSFNFYQSNALFAVNGYSRLSEPVDLASFVIGTGAGRLLSAAPSVPFVRGQSAYLNFIFAQTTPTPSVSVSFSVFSRAGNFITTVNRQQTSAAQFAAVNSVKLDIDAILDTHPTAGEIRAGIAVNGTLSTNQVSFRILPECLHELREFTFLNKWGGWEVFNFDAAEKQDIRRSAETYFKTTTPTSEGGPENVYSVEVDESFTVEGAPVRDEVAEWLKEFAGSPVILDNKGRQIILEDFNLSISPTAENMQVPTIKYRLNDTYTND